jgi:hypothetical protein
VVQVREATVDERADEVEREPGSYARSINTGSGVRSSAVNASRLMMSPRYAGSVTPPRVSESVERGFAYWPAMRPIRTIGFFVPWTSTRLICSRIFSFAAIGSERQSSKLSAQSPPCSTNASPRAAFAS